MQLTSLGFLFVLLPVGGLIYYFLRGAGRRRFLLGYSLLFVGLLSPLCLLLLLAVMVPDYLLARYIAMAHPRARSILLGCVIKDISLAVVCSILTELDKLILPVGISIAAFTSVGYLIDLYHGECDPIDDPIRYGVFCSFFGKLYIGPIVSAQQFVPQLDDPQMTAEGITRGMVQYLRGLAKIVILAGSLQELITQWETLLSLEVTILGTWLHVLCYIFYIYFTLSGYSDMARGTGAVFGLDLPENFHHPLQSYSVADFFGRFNISANRFVRKYVYQALGAEDNGPLSTSVNILLITMLMGLWYGINLNYLVWGAFLGLFIIFEVLYIERHVEKIPPYLCRMYTFIAILISFCWYCGDSLAASAASLRVMLGLGGAVFLVLALKLYQLQIKQHDYYQSKALDQQTRSTVVTASRGTIYDRNGNELAVSATAETVFLSPKELAEELEKPETKWTKESLSAGLSQLLGVTQESILEQMERTYSQYEVVKLRVDEDTDLQGGEPVTLVVRPEGISLMGLEETVPEGTALRGTIENYSFLGRMIRYWVRVGEEVFVIDDANVDLTGARTGDVQLRLDTRKLHVLKGGGADAAG